MEKLTGYYEEIIQPQPKKRSRGDENVFLFPVEGRQEVMTRVRTIIDVVSVSPPADGHIANAKAFRQCRVREVGRGGLDLSTNLGCRRGLLMQFDVHLDAPGRTDEEGFWQQSKDSPSSSIEHPRPYN